MGSTVSVKHVIAKYFSKHAETSEDHWDSGLQTHYYKTTKDKGLQALETFFNQSDIYQVNSISEQHGEISVNVIKGRKAFIIATIIMVRPYRTAIDFTVTTESILPSDFAYSSKLIRRLYHEFDKIFTLID